MHRAGVVIALVLLTSACASKGAAPHPFPGAPVPPESGIGPSSAEPATVPLLQTALSYRGVPYRNGGSDPTGFDCSGFVQWVFAQRGRALPREVKEQYALGSAVRRTDVQPGDLVFFETVSRGPSHVGIALGSNQFVHAPSSRGVVRVERYDSDYWNKRFVGARRLE